MKAGGAILTLDKTDLKIKCITRDKEGHYIMIKGSIQDIIITIVAQSCPTLCDPMDCSLPGSSLHGILQARVLEWVAISFSRGSSQPRDRTQGSNPGIEPGSPALYADVFTI